MRYKQRFFVCQLDFEAGADGAAASSATTTSDIFNALRVSVSEAFGDAGLGRMTLSLAVKYYSPVTRLCVIRGPLSCAAELHASIALVKACRRAPAALRTLQVCGSVRVLRESLRLHHAAVASALRSHLARDDLELDDAFFATLEGELADAA